MNSVEEALADEQTSAREVTIAIDHPRFGSVHQVGSPLRIGESVASHRQAPSRGDDEGYVLEEIVHYADERIDALRRSGAFGDQSA